MGGRKTESPNVLGMGMKERAERQKAVSEMKQTEKGINMKQTSGREPQQQQKTHTHTHIDTQTYKQGRNRTHNIYTREEERHERTEKIGLHRRRRSRNQLVIFFCCLFLRECVLLQAGKGTFFNIKRITHRHKPLFADFCY